MKDVIVLQFRNIDRSTILEHYATTRRHRSRRHLFYGVRTVKMARAPRLYPKGRYNGEKNKQQNED